MTEEEWRPAPRHEGFYDVSSYGQVRTWILSARHQTFREEPKLMKPHKRGDGYRFLRLRQEPMLLHHLVYEAFIGERTEGLHVRHLDGNQDNNHVTNLVLGTPAENAADKRRHGTLLLGEKVHNAKLDASKVREIRRLIGTEENREIAKRYGVSSSLISMIKNGKVWRHVH